MSRTPRLTRSVPFWILIVGSLAAAGSGAYLLLDRLGGMDARLTDGTATTNDVYVGQIWAVLGTVLIGAGLVGLALALTLGALRSLTPEPTAAEPAATDDDIAGDTGAWSDADEPKPRVETEELGYDADLGYDAAKKEPATADAPR
ncbi:hypothetical protein [Microbacterium sp. TNHR37B]|uniref:hypothetical protein n=1 Tax=Microbacterium sp. TNHR37B TaxID=1775956 RepID=UPI0007B2EA62|nr:hypothetical protein [Microbacterium sp. TNHR37B]KZE90747.1 hypothetical protein AVP41_00266 [Microbacterium sp. TNHR37B]